VVSGGINELDDSEILSGKNVEGCIAHFKVLFRHLLGQIEQIHEYLAGVWAYIRIRDLLTTQL
jgi:hypothetical protein